MDYNALLVAIVLCVIAICCTVGFIWAMVLYFRDSEKQRLHDADMAAIDATHWPLDLRKGAEEEE